MCTDIRIKIAWKLFTLTISILSPVCKIADNDLNGIELFLKLLKIRLKNIKKSCCHFFSVPTFPLVDGLLVVVVKGLSGVVVETELVVRLSVVVTTPVSRQVLNMLIRGYFPSPQNEPVKSSSEVSQNIAPARPNCQMYIVPFFRS